MTGVNYTNMDISSLFSNSNSWPVRDVLASTVIVTSRRLWALWRPPGPLGGWGACVRGARLRRYPGLLERRRWGARKIYTPTKVVSMAGVWGVGRPSRYIRYKINQLKMLSSLQICTSPGLLLLSSVSLCCYSFCIDLPENLQRESRQQENDTAVRVKHAFPQPPLPCTPRDNSDSR